MERKTMGAFIAALRKASGMTQKELAEKLNVSDKSVSRWERDDGAPDLSVIPVIAEVFGVTCDELLRGERRTEAQPAETTAKGEKQRKRILAVSLAQYRNRTFIAMGISVVGLIAAMIGNLGFLRAYIGFFAGCVFFLASVICQAIFINGALLSVDDDSLEGEEITDFRSRVISLAKLSFGLTLVLFAATLPLVIYVNDAYFGLTGERWLQAGGIYALIALAVWGIVCYFGNQSLLKKGVIAMDEDAAQKYRHNRKLLLRCVAGVLVVAVVTMLAQSFCNNVFSAWRIAGGEEFTDYESFVEYMEQPLEYSGYGYESQALPPPDDSSYFYDDQGNQITQEEFYYEEVIIPDGTPEGKVVCTFTWWNQNVSYYRTADTADGLPITAVTYGHHRAANRIVDAYNIGFGVLYCLELLGVVVYYLRKRMK